MRAQVDGALAHELHWQVLQRILFLYAKLNPGISYVQGMNDVLAPLYYVMATQGGPGWVEYAEADTFFCFVNLMSEIRDNFVRTLDNSASGILAWVRDLDELLRAKDPELWEDLVRVRMRCDGMARGPHESA